ncbi:MAG: hypothetical protein KY457_04575 [Actinobacteria bacterium]|nr:hypothetical protein [Actinomycetota bacterium]
MATWTELLDAYEATVAAIEAADVAGEGPAPPAWIPPAEPPRSRATPGELERFAGLQARAAACDDQLRAAMVEAGGHLAILRRTGVAARAYGQVDHLTGA